MCLIVGLKNMAHKFDLNERLISFAAECMDIAEALPQSFAGKHIAGQLIRSSTSSAIHYGEAQAPESNSDFIHKMKVCLKELRETFNCLKLIRKKSWKCGKEIEELTKENNELIAIFFTSIQTASKKQ